VKSRDLEIWGAFDRHRAYQFNRLKINQLGSSISKPMRDKALTTAPKVNWCQLVPNRPFGRWRVEHMLIPPQTSVFKVKFDHVRVQRVHAKVAIDI
jgi:hypothetical protein